MIIRVALAASAVLLASGCGTGSTAGPSAAAVGFAKAVEGRQGDQACSLLAPATRSQLESSQGKPCAQAVLDQGVPPSTAVRRAEQYGSESLVVLDRDVMFVAKFSIGWRVVAAGCKNRGAKLPYDCQVSGS